MKVWGKVISFSNGGKRAELVVKIKGRRFTRHVVLEKDGKYHYRKVDGRTGAPIHETYTLR